MNVSKVTTAYGDVPVGAHIKFEYDLSFRGGDYSGTGVFAYVPFHLLQTPESLTPEQAFTKHTGHEASHIVHYTLDELYDAQGNPLDD